MRSEVKGSGYILISLALIASAAALFFGFLAAQFVYLAVMFGKDGPLEPGATMVFGLLSYISVVTAALLFPVIALAAAAIAWLCWKTGTSRLAV